MAGEVHRLECLVCEDPFTVSADEEAWYRERNMLPPRTCLRCRRARQRAVREGFITPRGAAKEPRT